MGFAVAVFQLLRTQVRLKLYSLWHNEPLYRRTWYYFLATLAHSWACAGWRSDDQCDHPPNRRAARALALAASCSRSFGGAAVSSEASNRSEILAMSSTAE